jgi:hypothetical protein
MVDLRVLFCDPLLFLLIITYLPQVVQEVKVVLFTNDTNILLYEKKFHIFKWENHKSYELN